MRTVLSFFVVSVALFVAGIGFIIAGARGQRAAAGASRREAPATTPVASVKQIMNGIVMPNATVIYDAVGTTISAAGIENTAPRNDKEWARVGDSAAALVESGNLLLIGSRALDQGDWVRMTREFIDAGKTALKAADNKDVDGVFAAGGDLNVSCDRCHERYQRQ